VKQSRRHSFFEACANTVIGLIISFVAQAVLFKAYGIKASTDTQVWLVFWFTLVSIARSYVLRRFFNKLHHREVIKHGTEENHY
jgi:uncharacterized membrane protein (DUF106 family)